MIRELTCIECPNGCSIEVELSDDGKILSITGNSCPRGREYAENEVTCPKRVVTSTVRLKGGGLLPVKTDRPVPKAEIFEVMKKIHAAVYAAPVKTGDVIVKDISAGVNLVAAASRD